MPDAMRSKLEAAAAEGGRSLHAEILRRLEWSMPIVSPPQIDHSIPKSKDGGGELTWFITNEIKNLAAKDGVSFDEMLAKLLVAGIHPNAPQVLYIPVFPGATREQMRSAFEISEGVARPDAVIVSEMLQRAPWIPSWVEQRLKDIEAESAAKGKSI
jgi:hypothetical protein